MIVDVGCSMSYESTWPTPTLLSLRPRYDVYQQLIHAETFDVGGAGPVHEYLDSFGNRRQRVVMPTGLSRVTAEARVDVAGHLDVDMTAPRVPVDQLPDDVTQFLLPSRYCPSDLVFDSAIDITRGALPGYPQVEAIRGWIASEIRYEYGASHMSTSALDTLESRRGVCRDFAHLGISLCRAIDIPARMVAGYLHELEPMDAHAWFEAFVGHRWFSFDATQAVPRGGRVVIAHGRDAADVAMVTQFGPMRLVEMEVHVRAVTPQPGAV